MLMQKIPENCVFVQIYSIAVLNQKALRGKVENKNGYVARKQVK